MSKADQQLNSTGRVNSPDWLYRVIGYAITVIIFATCFVLSRFSDFLFQLSEFTQP